MSTRGKDPSLYRRRLRSELRRAREVTGMTQKDVAAAMEWSLSKVIRIETGSVVISKNDLEALVRHYRITDPAHRADLLDTGRKSRVRDRWWDGYRDLLSPAMGDFLGYEASATVIRAFEPLIVAGLLQTADYARAILRTFSDLMPDDVERLVRLRIERQALLDDVDPPRLNVLLDEAVLHRMVGGPEVMRAQLEHLRAVVDAGRVTLRVVPFGDGPYNTMRSPYVVFEFENPRDGAILYLESSAGDSHVIEDVREDGTRIAASPSLHSDRFDALQSGLSPQQTADLLDAALARLSMADATVDVRQAEPSRG